MEIYADAALHELRDEGNDNPTGEEISARAWSLQIADDRTGEGAPAAHLVALAKAILKVHAPDLLA